MKKSIFITLILAMLLSASAFAFGNKKTITGHIQIYGSAPMTFVGFITDEGKKYSLDIAPNADFTIQDIKQNQGKLLKLTGVVNEKELIGFQTLDDGRFVVNKFKVLTK